MPKNVRPSWIDLSVDGRKTNGGTGPKSRDGSMNACFSVRSKGDVLPLLDVEFLASKDKTRVLVTVTDLRSGETIFQEIFTQ